MFRPKVVILTGAGLSADSGIATYRGAGGIYDGKRAESIMSASGFRRAPELVHAMCDDRRSELADAVPNSAHEMLAKLSAMYGDRCLHFTQNIDDLAERAGVRGTMHVHGELTRMRSIGNSRVFRDIGHTRYWSGPEALAPEEGLRFRCPRSNSLFRPDVVLFNEAAPLYPCLFRTMRFLASDDLLMVVGTQGSVLPIARWAASSRCRKVLNNLHDSHDIDQSAFDVYIRDRASEAASRLFEIATSHLGEP